MVTIFSLTPCPSQYISSIVLASISRREICMDTFVRGDASARIWPLATGGGISAWPRRALTLLLDWQDRAQQRYLLQMYDDHMLRDIGLSRADVEHEAGK